MLRAVTALSALLIAAAILYSGNGLQFTLLSVRANIEGFPTPLIGAIVSAYYAGFIAGCRVNPRFIKSVGHIRTFVALASVASASALAHALIVDALVWAALRAVSGFCFAGMAMVLESWINQRVTNHTRGRVLSVYRIVDLVALATGNALLAAADPAGFHLFALVSILVSLALVPVALTRSDAPQPVRTAKLDIGRLVAVSPVAAVGAIMVGLANASFWSVGPIYVQRVGYGADTVAAFMSVFIIGAAMMQWPLGWLSDKIDRRFVIAGAGSGASAAAVGLALYGGLGHMQLYLFAFALGALMIPMFGLTVAHANDQSAPERAVETNGGLLLLHGCGSVIGAFAGAGFISAFGAPSLFYYIATVYLLLSIFCIFRVTRRSAVRADDKTPFVPVPKVAAPTVFEIAQEDSSEATGAA